MSAAPVTSATIAEHVAHNISQYPADDLLAPGGMIVDSEARNVTPETVHAAKVWSVWLTERGTVFVHGATDSGDDDEAEHAVELDGLTCSLDDDRWDEIYGRHPYTWDSNDRLTCTIELADATVFAATVSPDGDWQGEETGWVDCTTVHATLNGVAIDDDTVDGLELLAGWQEVTRW